MCSSPRLQPFFDGVRVALILLPRSIALDRRTLDPRLPRPSIRRWRQRDLRPACDRRPRRPPLLRPPIRGMLPLSDQLLLLGILVLAPLIPRDVREHRVPGDAQDQEQPEEVDGLQGGQQDEGDGLGNPALVLLGGPVELEGPARGEVGEDGDQDAQVDVVAQVDPDADEEDKVGDRDGRAEIVEDLGGLEWQWAPDQYGS